MQLDELPRSWRREGPDRQSARDLDETTERHKAMSPRPPACADDVRDKLVTGALAGAFVLTAAVIAVVVESARATERDHGRAAGTRLRLRVAGRRRAGRRLGRADRARADPDALPATARPGAALGRRPATCSERLPDYLSGREHPERASILLAGCWHAVGPTLVLAVAGEGPPRLAQRAVVPDRAPRPACVRRSERDHPRPARPRRRYREILGYLSHAYLIDLCLAPVGLAFAIAVVARPAGILLLFPLLFLMQSFARERTARIDQALELGAAYAGTGRLAEMYHELLAARVARRDARADLEALSD